MTNTRFVMKKVCLSWQNTYSSWQIFVATNIILSQQKFCHNQHTFVATKDMFCHDKHMTVTTNTCDKPQRAYFCRNKRHVLSWQTHDCHNKHVWQATTSILLSQQKTCFVMTNTWLSQQTHVCCDKTSGATKIILVTTPANDTSVTVQHNRALKAEWLRGVCECWDWQKLHNLGGAEICDLTISLSLGHHSMTQEKCFLLDYLMSLWHPAWFPFLG